MQTKHVVVVGAGMAGLVASLLLSRQGLRVTVVEKAANPGGKLRQVEIGQHIFDAGPTVFTMRPIFEDIFEQAGTKLGDRLTLLPLEILSRNVWPDGSRLDLFADAARSLDAIAAFAGSRDARGYQDFRQRSKATFDTLEASFITAPQPNVFELIIKNSFQGLPGLWQISPFSTLWNALGEHFSDDRLRQLFARYATYSGSSPFLCPATLMLIAHVEQQGVWSIDGGMYELANQLYKLAETQGCQFLFNTSVVSVNSRSGAVHAVQLSNQDELECDAVVFNADVATLSNGTFGRDVQYATRYIHHSERSLSAIVFLMRAKAHGFRLAHHNVFFSENYEDEFDSILKRKLLPDDPTVYVCAQDRADSAPSEHADTFERIYCLVNAPPVGDEARPTPHEIQACQTNMLRKLEQCGLKLEIEDSQIAVTGPSEFDRLYPGSGGALYGQANHGWMASFNRPASKTSVRGLYLAGGSVHPGAGLPMAAVSGRLAAEQVIADWT